MIQKGQFTACLKAERSTKTSMKVRVAYQLGRDLQGRPQYIIRTLSQESPKSPLFFKKFFSVALMLLFTCFASRSFLCCDVTFEADFFLIYPSLILEGSSLWIVGFSLHYLSKMGCAHFIPSSMSGGQKRKNRNRKWWELGDTL